MAMKRFHSGKLALIFLAMAPVVLAAFVLLWGIQYKCSLYQVPSQTPHTVPMAKLLSERERPAANRTADQIRTRPSLAAFFAVWLFKVGRIRRCHDGLRHRPLLSPRIFDGLRISSLPHFSFRPPPASAS